jgi:adenylate cyclase class 1
MDIADIRDTYLKWNQQQIDHLSIELGDEAAALVRLLPLLLHINNRFLPGYVSLDIPRGIKAYKPTSDALNTARQLNDKFRYNAEDAVDAYVIEGLYFQSSLLQKKLQCWVFRKDGLADLQVALLQEKLHKLEDWYQSRRLPIRFNFVELATFRQIPDDSNNARGGLWLDDFYSESVLLAGRYPFWWMVPMEREKEYDAYLQYVRERRFIEGEYLDLGNASEYRAADLLGYAISLVQQVKKEPDVCLFRLLLLVQKAVALPGADGVTMQIKQAFYQADVPAVAVEIMSQQLEAGFAYAVPQQKSSVPRSSVISPTRIVSQLRKVSVNLNPHLLENMLGDAYQAGSGVYGIDNVISHLNLFKAVSETISELFAIIFTAYRQQPDATAVDAELVDTANTMQGFLRQNDDRVPLYSGNSNTGFVFERIQLRHERADNDLWSLVLYDAEESEKVIQGFSSVLGLLAWCWLNGLVDQSTQVSVDCAKREVKQIEARYVLEILIQQIEPQRIYDVPSEAFEHPARPLQSLLFVNFLSIDNVSDRLLENDDPFNLVASSGQLSSHCEQLIINSWGDVHIRQYNGNLGIIECLCDWLQCASIDRSSMPQRLQIFGHGTADSTYLSLRVTQVYNEMQVFFLRNKAPGGRFILRLGNEYYRVQQQDAMISAERVGGRDRLLHYLERASPSFINSGFETLAFPQEPLQEIYLRNKADTIQVFYRVIGRGAICWVLDERGSLWRDEIRLFDRESFVTQWLYLYRNLRKRLKELMRLETEPPLLEIQQVTFNQLGGLEFYPVGAEGISAYKTFFDIQLQIVEAQQNEQLSLCSDGRWFSYEKFGEKALPECARYLSGKMQSIRSRPFYITDVDAPVSLFAVQQRGELQFSHLLKIKRTIEHKLYSLLLKQSASV